MNEEQFETELIQYITSGTITKPEHLRGIGYFENSHKNVDYVIKTKLWKYEPDIKTTEQLWDNFKNILERHNQSTLDHPLSVVEFNQVKKIISDIKTPYEAGQFLYGLNGVSQIEIDLDDGRHVFLTVFDQKQIGAEILYIKLLIKLKDQLKLQENKIADLIQLFLLMDFLLYRLKKREILLMLMKH